MGRIFVNFSHLNEGRKHPRKNTDRVSLSRLPATGPHLFGRETQLDILDRAWKKPRPCLVGLIAWAGVGKTSLVNHWLNRMKQHNYNNADSVYGWSFHCQGTNSAHQGSTDEFLLESLKWFGDPNPRKGTVMDKGRRLAQLVGPKKYLLILDGLEPLQYPSGHVGGFGGKLKDQGMKVFLRELAGHGQGLCIITSREKLTDLEDKKGDSFEEIPLEHLSPDAGAELLRTLGAMGSDREMAAAARDFDGHALALTLLGHYIKRVLKGDIGKRNTMPQLDRERHRGGHARRVMQAYENGLGDSRGRNILYIMGLFDRPVEQGALDALKTKPTIPGVTDHLQSLSDDHWADALADLRSAHLLWPENPEKPGTLDCHPLVREHFARRLADQNPQGWQKAHRRLYDYYKNLPPKNPKKNPDTLLELEPLLAAITHGCKVGLQGEVLVDVYWKRFLRGKESFINNKLGAFGSDLSALSHFYDRPWECPASGLPEAKKALVLSFSAFALRAACRPWEAVGPMKAGLKLWARLKAWRKAAIDASTLSELLLTLGVVSGAVAYARQSVTHADRSGDRFQKRTKRTTLADALHQSGALNEAEKWFREAEKMLLERHPQQKYLYSLPGFQYCDLLLGKQTGCHREVKERAQNALGIAKRNGSLLDISLHHLTLGRAQMMRALEEEKDLRTAGKDLDRALRGLREAGEPEFLARGLLARAEWYRRQQKFQMAWDDLNEARDIGQLGEMKLQLADYHLEAGWVCRHQGNSETAAGHFQKAAQLIKATGYKRREKDLWRILIN